MPDILYKFQVSFTSIEIGFIYGAQENGSEYFQYKYFKATLFRRNSVSILGHSIVLITG